MTTVARVDKGEINVLRLALPSNNRLANDTMSMLNACGIHVSRRGTGLVEEVRDIPECEAVFLRPDDIPSIIAEGGAHLGITGRDWFEEKSLTGLENVSCLIPDLGFGHSRLMLAAPSRRFGDSGDIPVGDLTGWARQLGRDLRVATKYPGLTQNYMEAHGISGKGVRLFQGSHELLPHLGAADLIADVVVTGSTLSAHSLTGLRLGNPPRPILHSSAALVACVNKEVYDDQAVQSAWLVLEYIHANLNAEGRYVVMANVPGDTPQDVARKLFDLPSLGSVGLKGPTIAPVVTRESLDGEEAQQWFSVSFVINHQQTEQLVATESLRTIGATDVIAFPLTQHFGEPPELPLR